MCPETLNFHVRAHFITSLQITLIMEWKHTATERTSVTSNTLLQEMFKMSSVSEDTCIHPQSHGIPDALMQPWRMRKKVGPHNPSVQGPLHRLRRPCFTMATLDFYGEPGSPPCRTVKMVAAAIGVNLNSKFVNLDTNEHLKPEFLKMNPQHTLPTLDDNGFYLWESRAIAGYLVDQYAKDDSLYPKDPKKRALVNQRLLFDLSTLYGAFADYYYPPLFYGAEKFDPEKLKKIDQAYDFLNTFLEGKEWVAGTSMTIADYSMVSSVGAAEAVGFDYKRYPNVLAWFERAKKAIKSYDEIYYPDAMIFKKWYDDAGGDSKK